MADSVLLVSDGHGIYIPQAFAQLYGRSSQIAGVDPEQWDILEEGPDGDLYWEVWGEVLDSAVIDLEGQLFGLFQEGDLWAVALSTSPEELAEAFCLPY